MSRKLLVPFAVLVGGATLLVASADAHVRNASAQATPPVYATVIGPGAAIPGQKGRYLISVTNSTKTAIKTAVITDVLPRSTKLLGTSRPYKMVHGHPTWRLNNLRFNQFIRIVLRVQYSPSLSGAGVCNFVFTNVAGEHARAKYKWCGPVRQSTG